MYRILFIVSLIATSCVVGLPKRHLQRRIVGGEVAKIENFPYQVSITYDGKLACAATIINEKWIVTAAHCVERFDKPPIDIRAGTNTWESGGTLHKASDIIIYQKYDRSNNYDGDIALISVTPPFAYGPGIQSISLVESEPKAGEMATISGWGAQVEKDVLSPELRFISVPIVERRECEKDYFNIGDVTPNMICAGLKEGGKDSCDGDVGGALVVGGKLAGIVSSGHGCAQPNYPGVYTNVAVLRDFVLSKTSD